MESERRGPGFGERKKARNGTNVFRCENGVAGGDFGKGSGAAEGSVLDIPTEGLINQLGTKVRD